MILKRSDFISELSRKADYRRVDVTELINAFESVIIDALSSASLDEDVEIQILKGVSICSRRVPEREARNPQDQSSIITPEKNIPYVKFTRRFREKINK